MTIGGFGVASLIRRAKNCDSRKRPFSLASERALPIFAVKGLAMNAPTTRALDCCECAAEETPLSSYEGNGGYAH